RQLPSDYLRQTEVRLSQRIQGGRQRDDRLRGYHRRAEAIGVDSLDAPTGLRHIAQGCRALAATLGQRTIINIFNPEGVAAPNGPADATPLGLKRRCYAI